MPFIQCTKKLLDELTISKEKTAVISKKPVLLGNWHANLLYVERRKCVLFTHDATLFSFFVAKLIKSDFQNLTAVFLQYLGEALIDADFEKYIPQIMQEYQDNLQITTSSNRRVLGSMNDMVYIIRFSIERDGGLERINPIELSRILNTIPFKAIQYNCAIECLRHNLSQLNEVLSQRKIHNSK